MMEGEETVPLEEVAKEWRVTTRTLRNLGKEGKLEVFQVGRRFLTTRAAMVRFVEQNTLGRADG